MSFLESWQNRMELKQIRLRSILLPSNVFMAPLAGYTCYPFRILCQQLGAGLAFTEMVSANGLKYQDKATSRLLFTTPEEKVKAVQLLGADPNIMRKASESEALAGFDVIDLNMGCPVPNVFKSGEGSALMGDFKRAAALIKSCKYSGKPVTVKCRAGITEDALIAAEFARMCEDAGADMISIHGRSRSMMYDGIPYFNQIEQAKSAVSIPVIANGGIFSAEAANEMMEKTGADGVMIGRYGLENPFIFSELTGKTGGIRSGDKGAMLLGQLELAMHYYDESFALSYMKKLTAYCMKKRRGTKHLKIKLFGCGNMNELFMCIREIFRDET